MGLSVFRPKDKFDQGRISDQAIPGLLDTEFAGEFAKRIPHAAPHRVHHHTLNKSASKTLDWALCSCFVPYRLSCSKGFGLARQERVMSMEMYVFSDRELDTVSDWQAAIDAEGYPLQLSADVQLKTHSGFLPMHLRGELTGFECDREDAAELIQACPRIDFGHPWKFALGFRWLGSKESELLAAWMAGTAYAHASGGVIFDGETGKIFTPVEGRKLVYDFEHPSPKH
jgi:hypothetical protein